MARVPASSETLGAPPVSDASPLCSCRVAGVPREAGAWRRGDQPSAAAVAWQAATGPPPPRPGSPGVQLAQTRLVSGPDAEAAGRARPASELSGDTPVKPGAWLHVFLSGGGHRGWGRAWVDREVTWKGRRRCGPREGLYAWPVPWLSPPRAFLSLPLHGASPLGGSVPRS